MKSLRSPGAFLFFCTKVECLALVEMGHSDSLYVRAKKQQRRSTSPYDAFEQLDGSHPWQTAVPEGFILYPVRELRKGQVAYFNFDLAKEMGLIAKDHSEVMTPALKEKLLETFSLQIINEYDQINQVRFRKGLIKQRHYMATRYLQLQHKSRTGKTSGDGRSIWNGVVRHNGRIWDVSSRGTGVTRLAPGVAKTGRYMKSGESDVGYGCGMAELDELMGAAVMSEIFHRQGIETERVLTVIDLGDGLGIGVRAGQNLIRPAHLFMFLKQTDREALRGGVNYLIDREHSNGRWDFSSRSHRCFEKMLEKLSVNFAKFAARLDSDYIFAWLDWDGDNVLAQSGIIDYGSIRQFGVRHDEYRYDDIERMSTNLREQKRKARYLVQVYAQMVDFLNSGKKKPVGFFRSHKSLKAFDRSFETEVIRLLLVRAGYETGQVNRLMLAKRPRIQALLKSFRSIEGMKTESGMQTLPDGENRPALFCTRSLLRELPLVISCTTPMTEDQIADLAQSMKTSHLKAVDKKHMHSLRSRLVDFCRIYQEVVSDVSQLTGRSKASVVSNLKSRSQVINRSDRITGNSAALLIEELLERHSKGLSYNEIQKLVTGIIRSQTLLPQAKPPHPQELLDNSKQSMRPHLQAVLTILETYKDDV